MRLNTCSEKEWIYIIKEIELGERCYYHFDDVSRGEKTIELANAPSY